MVNAYKFIKALEQAGLPSNIDDYTAEDWKKYDEIEARLEQEEKASKKERSDSYYIITSTVFFEDGSTDEVSTDVRTLSLEQLKGVTEILPKYVEYYLERLAEKDSQ
jgi:hypothetical protein